MNLLGKLIDRIRAAGENDSSAYWLFIKCDHCGEKLRTRVDLYNDLSIHYSETAGGNTYFCRKAIIGSERCFFPIEVELTFSQQRSLVNKQIQGGQFISEAEFHAE